MATAQDFWNEVDRRVDDKLDARLSGLETSEGTSAPPVAAGGLPIHNNAHHEPPLALQSDLESLAYLDLSDVIAPVGYLGQALKVPRVEAGEEGLEFHTLTAADVGALTESAADLLYAAIDHLQAVDRGGTGLPGIAADHILYSSAIDTLAATPLSAFMRGLLAEASADDARAELGAVGGSASNDEIIFWNGGVIDGDVDFKYTVSNGRAYLTRADGALFFHTPSGNQPYIGGTSTGYLSIKNGINGTQFLSNVAGTAVFSLDNGGGATAVGALFTPLVDTDSILLLNGEADGSTALIRPAGFGGAVQIKKNASAGGVANRYLALGVVDNLDSFTSIVKMDEDGNVDITGKVKGSIVRGCRVYSNALQGILTGTPTALIFTHEKHDNDGCWASGTPTRLIAQTAGYYSFGANAYLDSSGYAGADTLSTMYFALTKAGGGGETYGYRTQATIAGQDTVLQASDGNVYMGVGDFIEVVVYQITGGTVNVAAGSSANQHLFSAWLSRES